MLPSCLQTNVALVAPLLRLENNHCHIEESEHVLKKAHKYSELIILYEKKGLHEKGRCGVGMRRGEGIGAYALNLVSLLPACCLQQSFFFSFCSQVACCGLNWNDSYACKGINLFVCLKRYRCWWISQRKQTRLWRVMRGQYSICSIWVNVYIVSVEVLLFPDFSYSIVQKLHRYYQAKAQPRCLVCFLAWCRL